MHRENSDMEQHRMMQVRPMELLTRKTIKAILFPGGGIVLAAALLLGTNWLSLAGIGFFYYAVFIAAALLSWRFHSTRILFAAVILLLGHHAMESFAHGQIASAGSGRVAFETVSLLIPLNFMVLTFFPERGSEGRTLGWFLALLFFESVFVAAISGSGQPVPGFLHWSLIPDYHWRVPQPALLAFLIALGLLLARLIQRHRATDSGMFWTLIATWLGLEAGGAGKTGSAFFGAAALVLATSIIENSYSLAYQDELTGLASRRAFNDALLRLQHPYAIAAVDIDHFKRINDNFGHDTGDQVLRLVASRLARVTGGGEAFRVGGEEFTILFAGRSVKDVADHLELLRMNIESSSFKIRAGQERRKAQRDSDRRAAGTRKKRSEATANALPGAVSMTVSIGIAESQPKLRAEEVIEQADQALYRAKQGGRNRIETAIAPGKIKRARAKKSAHGS
jgi:diguanylate cyclase (GGDEF)-like protein